MSEKIRELSAYIKALGSCIRNNSINFKNRGYLKNKLRYAQALRKRQINNEFLDGNYKSSKKSEE